MASSCGSKGPCSSVPTCRSGRPRRSRSYLGGAAGSIIIAFVLTGNPMLALGVLLLALIAPGFVVDFLAKRRKKKFTRLLPDMLQLLAGTLRAGYSIGQGFEAVSGEIGEPMGKELRAVTEARLGRPSTRPWRPSHSGWTAKTSGGPSWRSASSSRGRWQPGRAPR